MKEIDALKSKSNPESYLLEIIYWKFEQIIEEWVRFRHRLLLMVIDLPVLRMTC